MCRYLFSAVLGQAGVSGNTQLALKIYINHWEIQRVCRDLFFHSWDRQGVSGNPQQVLKIIRVVKEIYRGV